MCVYCSNIDTNLVGSMKEVMGLSTLGPCEKAIWCFAAANGEVSTCDIADAMGLHRQTVLHHTRRLSAAGLMSARTRPKQKLRLYRAVAPALESYGSAVIEGVSHDAA